MVSQLFFIVVTRVGSGVSRSYYVNHRYTTLRNEGGGSYGFPSVTEYLFMGSGGGGGARGSQCCGLPGRGGNGGGIIIIATPVLAGNEGAIIAHGTRGQDTGRGFDKTAGGYHGAGGGGSGGSVLIMTSLSTTSGVVKVGVEGGPGGTSASASDGYGGDGSRGRQTIVDTSQLSGPMYSFWI